MKIIRAGYDDTDMFSKEELDSGACCFFTEDKSHTYFFEIRGREAILFSNDAQYIRQVIDEFLYFSSFIHVIKDKYGRILAENSTKEPYLLELSHIQPSQFYINERKLESCKKWIKSPKDIILPICIKDGKSILLDGHTRLRAAADLGYPSVYVYCDDYDETIFHFVDEAIKRKVYTVMDMELLGDEDYKVKWDQFCDDLFENLESYYGD